MRPQLVNLLYRTTSVIALLIGALGLVGLVLSEDDRAASAVMIGVAVLIWMVAYAMQHVLAPHVRRSAQKRR
ncbi:MAG TPA: hypothetical protein VKB68_06510 [Stellaceae bacterium]|nr:hypothetical protein [Stellaceae bacterium]